MARIGMNPSRTKYSSYRPQRVTVAVLVHIPHFSGYFEHRLPVLQACLTSLVGNTSVPFDLMVLDNGSCQEVADFLQLQQREGTIQFLLRSRTNLGKVGAFQIIFRAAPGELVAYCDDDFLFYPGWLESQLALVDRFPKVGMVSGYSVPTLFDLARISSTLEFAIHEPKAVLNKGKFIPDQWIRDWAESTGRDGDEAVREGDSIPEYVIEYEELSAFATANHDQFLAPKEVIQSCLPGEWGGELMGRMIELDKAVNQAGYLRLTTRDRTTQHIGNVLQPGLPLGSRLGAKPGVFPLPTTKGSASRYRRFLRWPPIRAVLLGLYSRLFHLINPD